MKFALYNDTECYFDGRYIEKTTDFCANTAIEYKGETIAIWMVQEDLDIPVFASKLVHEMFHGYQHLQGWTCYAPEMEALYKYQYSGENLSLKLYENKLLLDMQAGFDPDKYRRLLECRKYRSAKFPYEFEYECTGEEHEGSANYVEWQVLKQLDEKKAEKLIENMRKVMIQPEFFAESKRIVDSAVCRNEIVLTGPLEVVSVNIYDARCYNGYITSRFFLMYMEDGERKIIRDNYVIKMKDESTLETVYRWV